MIKWALKIGNPNDREHFFCNDAAHVRGIMDLVCKGHTLLVLQKIAEIGQPRYLLFFDERIDCGKTGWGRLGADGIVGPVGIVVIGDGLPETL